MVSLSPRLCRSMPAGGHAVSTSWAATLRLPKSLFPARPVVADRPKYLKRACGDLYEWQRTAKAPKQETFVLQDGPPYANGDLHVGHALNKILKDIICRARLSEGRRVSFVPGWDCHGMPIEHKALNQRPDLRQEGLDRRTQSVRIREAARELAARTVEEQKTGFKQWAVMGDWDNAWRTMDKDFELKQLEVFRAMLEQGLVYQSLKPVHWSPSSQTALAEAELEYNPVHKSRAVFVKARLLSYPEPLQEVLKGVGGQLYIAVWTTTPWTLPANRAIAVKNTMEYRVVSTETYGNLIVASSRLEELEKILGEHLEPLATPFPGHLLVGAVYEAVLPDEKSQPRTIIHADFIKKDSGTGLVHMAPGHGNDDYKRGLALGFEPYAPVDHAGKFVAGLLPDSLQSLGGMEVLASGNVAVLKLLSLHGTLLKSYNHTHSYPYDWRTKQPVIVRATKQWFARVDDITQTALQSLENVRFIPEAGKERLSSFISNRTEWCISRQRAWGVPIPALYDLKDGSTMMNPESVNHIISVVSQRGIDAWWTDDELDQSWVVPAMRHTGQYRRGTDTLDVWFDSGTSWSQTKYIDSKQVQRADVYIEGSDQHRGWFQSSLLTKIAAAMGTPGFAKPEAPFKTLITHGFTLDKDGKKMSKSVGNVVDPAQIMDGTLLPPLKRKGKAKPTEQNDVPVFDAMGPDALRMWVASCDYTRDVIISVPVLKAVNAHISKLRVTFKLLTGLLDTHEAGRSVDIKDLDLTNRIVIMRLAKLEEAVQKHFVEHDYHKATTLINNFVAVDFSAMYVEAIKDRMYADATLSPSRVSTQVVLWEIFQSLTKMLAPITPILVEEALDYLPAQLQSYHPIRSDWGRSATTNLSGVQGLRQDPSLEHISTLLTVIDGAVKAQQEVARSAKKMGSSLQSFASLHLSPLSSIQPLIEHYERDIEDMLVVSHFEVTNSPPNLDQYAWSQPTTLDIGGETCTVVVYEPSKEKCTRCWKYTVPHDHGLESALCHRCVGVLEDLRDGNPAIFDGSPNLDARAHSCRKESNPALEPHWHLESTTSGDTHAAEIAKQGEA